MEIESHESDSSSHPANDRLIHGLLSSVADAKTGAKEVRLSQAMEAITNDKNHSETKTLQPVWRRRQFVRSVAMSAAAAAALIFMFVVSRLDTATAAQTIEWLKQVAAQSVDRRYRFSLELRKPNRFGSTQIDGVLFVRGAEASLQRFNLTTERLVTIGRTQEHVWIMGQRGPVIIRDAEPEPRWGPTDDEAPELLSLVAVLERLQDGFELNFERSDMSGAKRISAKNLRQGGEIADKVMFDYDAQTGNILDINLIWSSDDRPVRLQIEFEETLELPINWYDHTLHHEPDRRTIDRTSR